ncbi:phosphomevalonate kinase [Anthonomus grandis grandis]|uniref:phosphomevalonate kinase n=1 Tax=Anthonomus grandis grandis TaxID=2921223 RepID=UPI0021663064|nr:phosphomevalonate kinase [Anthonomus grandis grandis]
MSSKPHILLFSGKRKSGKDYICEKLKSVLGENKCCVIRISAPIKKSYAENHNLDFNELLSDSPYKETYRLDMINWSEEVRKKDPGFFCKVACSLAPNKDVWIISDIRRKSDIKWFKENYTNLSTIRISADLDIRKQRGWIFTKGVDDVESECGLDDFGPWDVEFVNDSNQDSERIIQSIQMLISQNKLKD